jgi:hypothetical protein
MARRKKKPAPVLAWASESPVVELIWVAPSGEIMRTEKPWKRAATSRELGVWMMDYLDRLARGYRPEGYGEPPVPHCARVSIRKRVVAEWNRPLTIEEMRRLDEAQAS